MATEQDAARDRVLAARADLAEQLQGLQASGRAAVDIPARIKRSPAKAAALAGGIGFLALKGPQRVLGRAKRAVRGEPAPLPEAMLPPEIEKTLKKLGKDGDRVRGALEHDFAEYVQRAQKQRKGVLTVLLLAAARPLLTRGTKALAEFAFTPDREAFNQRLAEVRERAERGAKDIREAAESRAASARTDAGPERPAEDPAGGV